MPLAPSTVDAVRRDWAERLDCSPAAFERSGATVAESPDGRTVRLLRRRNATVAGAPTGVGDALAADSTLLAQRPLTEVAEVVREALSNRPETVTRVHGPAVLGYVDSRAFTPTDGDARLLDDGDEAAFERLRDRVPDPEWARASPRFRPARTAGLFRDGELAAVATLGDPPFGDVGVVVDEEFRGKGYGQQVVSRVVAAAFDRGEPVVPRYRTPETESASLALAAALGFERWASETVVVLE